MIRFLLQRPIAVLMAFTACFIVDIRTKYIRTGIGKHRREAGPFAIDASGRITGYP